ncbi:MAG: PKD domain-containing protein, partial [Bacteroidetes bacterium]|nr:PKD domain-containing protein [Bacteroidota bacterium]
MKFYLRLVPAICLVVVTAFLFQACSNKRSGSPKVLVFSKTAGFYHQSIPDGIRAIQRLGDEHGFEVDTTTNSAMFTEDSLEQYSAVVFLSTTGDVLNHDQEADFERYIQSGGGYVGIHAAADTEYHWGWYGRMVGGYFLDHPGINDPHPNVQEGTLHVEDATHSSTEFLPEEWTRTDEWYSYKNFNEEVNVLLSLDEDSYQGGADMGFHPMAWYHEYDGGRVFYTGLGHTSESFTEDLFLQHMLAGIQYAIGENELLDYDDATTEHRPAENRFTKTPIVQGEFYEPTEMTILPNLDVLIAQRRGEILYFNHQDSSLSTAAELDVYHHSDAEGVNAEEGLMGIQADPNFEENNHVFVFYSPADTSVNRLSRFLFDGEKLDMETETTVLEFYSQRDICCHTGGSIAFDSDGLLYLSTGDNSTPFNQKESEYVLNGYAPIDNRSGYEQYNAMRTSGNPNDLRGKIIRIRVNEDGSYEIPEGNLYEQGQEGTKPEIYIQGNRNPYRISVDQKTNYLYWGEVGPDASNDSLQTRGPKGYDEVNQAREAGNFGWPMFVGDNYPYVRFNYAIGESAEAFDPENPVNDYELNTGVEQLPPAKPAFIWYPYGESEEFGDMGSGGRNAMAGPVFYSDLYPEETRMPDYYDGKLFIYDWVRGWIKAVTMWPNGDFSKMEPFMPSTELNSLIDMEIGPDGRLYLLEYGSGWFTKNPDAGLSRVDFNAGNRPPVVGDILVDKTSGTLPLTVNVTANASDPEDTELTYIWDFGNGMTEETTEPQVEVTYEQVGDYSISVEVRDPDGLSGTGQPASVYAGNAAPLVDIEINGNSTFYFPDTPVSYSVSVNDPNDPTASEDLSGLYVSADYIESSDMVQADQGHQVMANVNTARTMIETLNCQACHGIDAESIGPSYTAMAELYEDSSDVTSHLVNKIINGGSGVWGETVMPGHINLSEEDAEMIVEWIQTLNDEEADGNESLPAEGTVDPTLGKQPVPNGMLILSASFTDNGGSNVKPLTGSTSIYLRNNTMTFDQASNLQDYTTMTFDGNFLMMVPDGRGSFSINDIDLTDISTVSIISGLQEPLSGNISFELRLNSPDGEKIGEAVYEPGGEFQTPQGFL